MHKKKFTEEQAELLALLPQGLPKMTDGAKLVLAQIIMLYGTDFAKTNGYVFRSTDDMLKDTEISSKTTLSRANRQLTQLGLITVKSGSYESRTANEYRLSDEMLEKIGFNQSVLMGTHMGTLSESMGTLCENEVIKQLVEQNKSLMLMVNELSKQVKYLSEQVESITKNSKCTTDTDTDTEIEKEKKDLDTIATSTCTKGDSKVTHTYEVSTDEVETISAETVKASAPKDSSSLIEEEMASAHEHISTEGVTLISSDEAGIISADDNITSTEDELTDETDVISTSSNDNLSTADRLTLLQCFDKNPPRVPLHPPLTEFKDNVMKAIRKGVYQWSLTLTDIPEYLTGDDTNPIVSDALRKQPDYENHLGNVSIMELSDFAKEMMENRLKNKDIPAIVRENQYRIRHEAFRKELVSA